MNPIATEEQRELEELALRLMETDAVQRGRESVEARWKTIVGPANISAEAEARLGELVDEFTFNYVLKAAAGDPNHPRVLGAIWSPPHEWFGMQVPGSRSGGGDCPDNHYVVIPVEYGARYEIRGRRPPSEAVDIPLLVTGNPMFTMTLGAMDLSSTEVAGDGSFELTVGPARARGNPNHVQTAPGAMYLFIRYSRSDWRQAPDALEIRRVDPPSAEPWTEEQMAARAAAIMAEDIACTHWWMRVLAAVPPNTVPPPRSTGGVGGLPSQSTSFSRLRLADDEAFAITVEGGGAGYRSIALYDFWFRSIEYWRRSTSLNNEQSAPNPDGTLTYVVSHEDPGIANWLDGAGLRELLMIQRWQRVPGVPPAGRQPSTTGRLVKLDALEAALPESVPRADPEERRARLDERLETFLLRFRTD